MTAGGDPYRDNSWRQVFEQVPAPHGQLVLWAAELGVPGELARDRGEGELQAAKAAREAREAC